MATFSMSELSRYKDTAVYESVLGTPEFALFEAPIEFTEDRIGYREHRVSDFEIGALDALAVKYFGPGYEELWWVIALVNGILDSEMEMRGGQVILIPPREAVLEYIARVPNV
jgi:hypothetical protein